MFLFKTKRKLQITNAGVSAMTHLAYAFFGLEWNCSWDNWNRVTKSGVVSNKAYSAQMIVHPSSIEVVWMHWFPQIVEKQSRYTRFQFENLWLLV